MENDTDKLPNGAAEEQTVAEDIKEIDEIAKLKEQNLELYNRWLSAEADLRNEKSRQEQQEQKASQYAIASFATEIVEVFENMLRAFSHTSAASDDIVFAAIKNGIELNIKLFETTLTKYKIKRIYPEGEKFDHNYHQAISQMESNTVPSGTVLQVVRAGYTLNDRLLQAALVIVATNAQ